jgi:polysaccharide pyruvyl transferase WcaK-like protein
MPTIGISGSYGGLNLGDEAILTCAVEELRAAMPDVTIVVFSRHRAHTEAHHAVNRVYLREIQIALELGVPTLSADRPAAC